LRAVAFIVAAFLGAAPGRRIVGRQLGARVVGLLARLRGRLVRRGARGRVRVARHHDCSRGIALSVLALEDRVLHQQALDFLVELDGRELQQADRLLQLRRQREVLREPELEGWFHRSAASGRGDYIRKCSPRYTRRTLSL
jgi:hypothetical protein